MPRTPKLNYDRERKVYRAQVNGRRVRFTANKRESEALLRRLLVDNESPQQRGARLLTGSITVGECLRRFIKHKQRDASRATAEWYGMFLKRFEAFIGSDAKVRDLRLGDATRFIDECYHELPNGRPYSRAARRGARRAVKSCFDWNVREGFLDSSPFSRLGLGPEGGTEARIVSDEQFAALISHWRHDRGYTDLLWFLRLTGCRVQEARILAARHFDRERHVATLSIDETKCGERTLIRRQIILSNDAREIAYWHADRQPDGPIFRNSYGKPWTANAIRCRLKHASEKIGLVRARDLRHTFATHFLKQGGGVAALKELLGHRDERMIMRIYQHLAKDADFLRAEANRISRVDLERAGGVLKEVG